MEEIRWPDNNTTPHGALLHPRDNITTVAACLIIAR